MKTDKPTEVSRNSLNIHAIGCLLLLTVWTGANASFAQERILDLDNAGAKAGGASAKPGEPAIRLLSKAGNRADFECSAPWCRASRIRLNSEEYTVLELPGGGDGGEIGDPQLPCYGKFIQVPDGAEVRLVIDKVDWVPIEGKFDIAPRQPPPVDKAGAPPPPFTRNKSAYERDDFSPAEIVRIADRARIRRKEMVYVVYTPIVYNPVKGSLKAGRRVQWHLEYDLPKKKPAPSRSDATGQREFGPILQRALDAQTDAGEPPSAAADLGTGNGADYLIITHDNFYTNILPLANWKHAKGLITRVVRLSEISPAPTSTNITAFIQNAYNTWNPPPTYVLLVGDSPHIPAWYKTLHSYYGTYAATDLYYAAIDGSDYFPDLFLGRLPCNSSSQCDLMVQKILGVEKAPNPTAAMYQTVLTAGQFADDDVNGYEDRLFIETAEAVRDFFISNGYSVPTAYCADSTVTPRRYNNTANGSLLHTNGALYGGAQTYVTTSAGSAAISNAINSGVWLVQHRDHGSQTGGWATPPFSPSRASALVNSNKLPVVMSINCETAWFDGSGDSLAEAFLKNPNGGSHCVIGATRVSYSWYNDWFTLGLYECMYTNFFETLSSIPYYKPGLTYGDNMAGHGTHFGQMLNFGKVLMYEKKGAGSVTQIEFDILTLLGDPEQSPRTAVPQLLTASHPGRLLADVAASFDVTVSSEGAPLRGALVALVLDPADYHTALTDGAGVAHFSFTPQAPQGNNLMSVTVSHQNGIPYEGFITIDTSRIVLTVPAAAREGDGVLAGQGLATVFPMPTNDLVVSLSSSDVSELTVPGSVLIPSGQTNAAFDLTIVDDAELDGTQPVVITANATGYATATNTIAVQDNETATLAVSLPAAAAEGSGMVQATLSVSAAPAASVAVELTSSDTSEAQVPAVAIIAAGQTTTHFNVMIVDDIWIDGPQAVSITAHVAYWSAGNATMLVLDNEPTNLTVTLPAQAREGDGTLTNAGLITVAGPLTTDLMISLVSSDTTELAVPPGITLPASNTTARFNLYVQDDPDVDSVQARRASRMASAPCSFKMTKARPHRPIRRRQMARRTWCKPRTWRGSQARCPDRSSRTMCILEPTRRLERPSCLVQPRTRPGRCRYWPRRRPITGRLWRAGWARRPGRCGSSAPKGWITLTGPPSPRHNSWACHSRQPLRPGMRSTQW
jgi:hypothetical protein